jgi:hypothetical protein
MVSGWHLLDKSMKKGEYASKSLAKRTEQGIPPDFKKNIPTSLNAGENGVFRDH